jgi:voltage-gated potassium channel
MVRRKVFAAATVALAGITAVGVAGYMAISGMGFSDALYMTVITLTTVGYREVVPLDTAGQYFTMALLIGGLGIVFYSAALLARELLEGELQRVFGRRRMQRQIAQLRDHIIVCGFGRMGRIVCKELAAKPAQFVIVDRDPEAVRHAEGEEYPCLEGDATEDDVLTAAGIGHAKGLVAALSNDADNVYAVLTARELNPHLVIVARAEDDRSERKLLHAGATRVVSPYVIGGHRMAHALLRPAVLDVLDLATHHRSMELQIEEVTVAAGSFCAGATVAVSGIRDGLGLIVIAIKKPSGEMLFNPTSDTRIEADDRLVLMGSTANLREIERRLHAG